MLMMSAPQVPPPEIVDGLSCSLTLATRQSFNVFPLVVRLKCTSRLPVEVDFGKNEIGNLRFLIQSGDKESMARKLSVPAVTFQGRVKITPDQPFDKRISLSELQSVPLPAELEVVAQVVNSVSGAELVHTNTLAVHPEEGTVSQLRSACLNLAAFMQKTVSFEQQAEIAYELANVRDPVVLPILASLLGKIPSVDMTLIDGLRDSRSVQAEEALRNYISTSHDRVNAMYAENALRQMVRGK